MLPRGTLAAMSASRQCGMLQSVFILYIHAKWDCTDQKQLSYINPPHVSRPHALAAQVQHSTAMHV